MQEQKPSYETKSYEEFEKEKMKPKQISYAEFLDEYNTPQRKAERAKRELNETGKKLGNAVSGAAGSVAKFVNSPTGKKIGQYLVNAGQRSNQSYGLSAFSPGGGTVRVSKHYKQTNKKQKQKRHRHKKKVKEAPKPTQTQPRPAAPIVYIGAQAPREKEPPQYP